MEGGKVRLDQDLDCTPHRAKLRSRGETDRRHGRDDPPCDSYDLYRNRGPQRARVEVPDVRPVR
jgi:hypothetical protein